MNRIYLMLAGVMLFFGYANAVELRQDNQGRILIFPFFTTENQWDSLINVTIAHGEPVILKVRVRNGTDGTEVNRFNIYTFGLENWQAGIGRDENGQPIMRIAEGRCTINDRLQTGGVDSVFNLGANKGTIEVYAISAWISTSSVVANCQDAANRWAAQGRWLNDPQDGLSRFPAPLISGELTLVNVENGMAASYSATALHEFTDKRDDKIPHTSPTNPSPNLADATPVATLSNGVDVVPVSGQGIDAVAMTLTSNRRASITNDVVTETGIAARTDWVLSYPLDGYKHYRPFTVSIDGDERHCETFGLPPLDGEPVVEIQATDENGVFHSWGQGQVKGGQGVLLDPPPVVKVAAKLCHTINVISFNGKPSILEPEGSPNLTQVSGVTVADTSQLSMGFVQPFFPEPDVRRPVLGFRLTTFVNGTLNGGRVLANYAVLKPH